MDQAVQDSLRSLYGTVDASTTWSSALARLSDTTHAHGAMLALERPHQHISDVLQHGFDEGWLASYTRDWAARSPFLARLYEDDRALRGFVASHELMPYEDWVRTPMFNESGRLQDVHYGAAACIDTPDDMKIRISFVRDRSAGPFTRDDLNGLDVLLPHLQQALRLGHAFEDPTTEYLRDMDARCTAAFVVDGELGIRACNATAEAIIEGPVLRCDRDTALVAGDAATTDRLRTLVQDVCLHGHGQRHLLVRDGPDAPALSLLLSEAPGRAQLDAHGFRDLQGRCAAPVRALVTVVRRDRPETLSPELLRACYALTPAESRLAQRIASGNSPDEAARALGVRISTVRWHLKRVFAKTGVSGQTELVALLQSLSHAVVRNGD